MNTAKIETVRARVSSQLKADSEQVLHKLGLNISDAIRLFLTQVAIRKEFPIELKIPNEGTLKAMNATTGETESYESVNELFNEVKDDHAKTESNQSL